MWLRQTADTINILMILQKESGAVTGLDAQRDSVRDNVLAQLGYTVNRFVVGKKHDLVARVEEFLAKEKLV